MSVEELTEKIKNGIRASAAHIASEFCVGEKEFEESRQQAEDDCAEVDALIAAAEQRVRDEERSKWSDLAHDNWQNGWEEALQAARDAVAALGRDRSEKPFNPAYAVWSIRDALAAIDALTPSDGRD